MRPRRWVAQRLHGVFVKALISGISGFVGSHLAEYLIEHTDWEIFGMTRWNDNMDNVASLIPLANRGERIWFIEADLRDTVSVDNLFGQLPSIDYVFHLAAQSYPLSSYRSPLEAFETNAVGTLHLMEAIRGHCPDALVHNCSSSEVYGRPDKTPTDESAPFHPMSPYAISKATADMTGRFYHEAYGLKVITTRMFTHTGPRRGDVFAESSFAKQLAMIEIGQLKPPIMVGNLKSIRTVADVRDAVRAYHMLLTVDPQPGEVYNIGGAHTERLQQILQELMRAAGNFYDVKVDEARLRPLDADLQIPDCSKFARHTGWEPRIPFTQTMADLMDYWRERVTHGVPLQR